MFDGNVLYNSDGGSIFMGSGKNYITNNISLQKTYGMGPYISMQGFTFANNYSEAANPFVLHCHEAKGAYTGTFERFAISGNVFNNTGGWIDYRGNIVDARQCKIDGNVTWESSVGAWSDAGQSAAGRIQGLHELCILCGRYSSLAELCELGEELAVGVGGAAIRLCIHWMRSSTRIRRWRPVLQKIRQYVKGVISPYPGAGPVLDE